MFFFNQVSKPNFMYRSIGRINWKGSEMWMMFTSYSARCSSRNFRRTSYKLNFWKSWMKNWEKEAILWLNYLHHLHKIDIKSLCIKYKKINLLIFLSFSIKKMKIVCHIEDMRVVNIFLNRGRINHGTRFQYNSSLFLSFACQIF